MGIQGLRKFIDSSSCTKTTTPSTSTEATTRVDHVLIDMNCIVHSCYGKHQTSPKETIAAVVERLTVLLTHVVAPTKSLTLCFDGPAPVAKLHTQRLRRRKLSHMDLGNNTQFCDLSITTGSLFMVQLENRIAQYFQNNARTALLAPVPIYVFGSTCIGEGEAKIAMALSFLASDRLEYRTGDQVVLIGNDIDLTLTCLGATQYHNLYVLGPSSLQVISVGDILHRWLMPSMSFLTDVAQLPSARIDMIFLFLLNGGDHYTGLGEAAMELWKRYRMVKAAEPHRSIVSNDLMELDIGFLGDVLQVSQYQGTAEANAGVKLLKAALWSLLMTVSGKCPDFHFCPDEFAPSLCNVKAALAAHTPIRINVSEREPLTPLATYVALMPTLETIPENVRKTVLRNEVLAKRLMTSNEPKVIAAAATEAVRASEANLSQPEKFLCQFSTPVHVNFLPKQKHLSRHEQHRQASGKAPQVAEVKPQVVPIHVPDFFDYQCCVYKIKELRFKNVFTDAPEKRVAVNPSMIGKEDQLFGDQDEGDKASEDDDGSVEEAKHGLDADVDAQLRKFLGKDADDIIDSIERGDDGASQRQRKTPRDEALPIRRGPPTGKYTKKQRRE